MKKFQKNITKIFTTIITMMIILVSANKVNAAENTIQLGDAHYAGNYIAGVYFTDKTTKDGKYLYCLDLPKNTAANITANLVRDSKYIDGGLIYILANGYPEKSITKDNQKDYYITQTAVWWYLDEVYGTSNLGNEFKTTGDDSSNLRKYVKQLVEDGKKHKNDFFGEGEFHFKIDNPIKLFNKVIQIRTFYSREELLEKLREKISKIAVSVIKQQENEYTFDETAMLKNIDIFKEYGIKIVFCNIEHIEFKKK